MRQMKTRIIFTALAAGILTAVAANAQEIPDTDVKIIELTPGIHVLMGVGGNIGVSSGDDGVFMIDDDMPPLAEKIEAAVRSIHDEPVSMVFNTHWHFDHTAGTSILAKKARLSWPTITCASA